MVFIIRNIHGQDPQYIVTGIGGIPSFAPGFKPPPQPVQQIVPDRPPDEFERKEWVEAGKPKTKILTTSRYFEFLQQEEAKRIARSDSISTRPGEHIIKLGTYSQTVTPTEATEIIRVGERAFVHKETPPEGSLFVSESSKPRVQMLAPSVKITEEGAKAAREELGISSAPKVYEKATPLEKIGLEARTLLSERGTEYIGGAIVGGREDVVKEKIATDILATERGEKVIQPNVQALGRGGGLLPMTYSLGGTTQRGMIEGLQSPVVEVEMAFAGGAVLGAATKIPTIANIMGSTAGKAGLYTVGAASLGVRGVDIAGSYAAGEHKRAVGLIVTTALDIPAAFLGYKLQVGKQPHFAEKLEGLTKTEETTTYKIGKGFDKGLDIRSAKVSGRIEPMDIPGGKITSSEVRALQKAGYRLDTTKTKVMIGKQAFAPGKTVLYESKVPGISLRETTIKPTQFYVARETGTGQIVQVGKKVSFLREIGITRGKFYDKPFEVKVVGIEAEKTMGLAELVGGKFKSVETSAKVNILKLVTDKKPPTTSPTSSFKIVTPKGGGSPSPTPSIPDMGSQALKLAPPVTKTITVPQVSTSVNLGLMTQLSSKATTAAALGTLLLKPQAVKIESKQKQRAVLALSVPRFDLKLAPALSTSKVQDLSLGLGSRTGLTTRQTTRQITPQVPALEPQFPKQPSPPTQPTRVTEPPLIVPGLPGFGDALRKRGRGKSKKWGTFFIKNPVPEIEVAMKGVKVKEIKI